MITTITLNPALDKTITVNDIQYGEVNRVGHFREDLGGKGINVGRILSGFAVPTMNLAILGDDNQSHVMDYFRKDQMAIDYIGVEGRTRTNIKIVETDLNRTTDINEEGVKVTKEAYEAFLKKVDQVAEGSDYIIMGGSLAGGVPMNAYGEIARRYKHISKVVIDADDDVLMEGLKGEPFLIKPNIHELEKALDRKLETDASIITAARDIILMFNVTYVLVSMGAQGSLLVSETEAYKGGTIPTKVVSTVGAGDAMVAGFIYSLSKNRPLKDCLAFASACSTLTIAVEGYPKLDLDEVFEKARIATVTKIE